MNASLLTRYAAQMPQPASPADAEAEIIAIIDRVARRMSFRYRFGYHEIQDIRQQAMLEGLMALDAYDVTRPLENFLSSHISRRLMNFKRNQMMRPEAPCQCCDPFNPPAEPCVRWHRWNKRNTAKQNLNQAGSGKPVHEQAAFDEQSLSLVGEIDQWVDDTFSPHLRADYLRMKQGVTITPARRAKVRHAILARFGEGADHADAA